MPDDRKMGNRDAPSTDREKVEDLREKPLDAKDAQQVKGGRLHDDEAPK